MLKNCDCCLGKKKVLGLGNIIKDCVACKGIGWIEIAVLESEPIPEPAKDMTQSERMKQVWAKKRAKNG